MFEDKIVEELKKHVSGVISLEVPPAGLGDFAFPCFSLAKELKKAPVVIAKELAGKLKVSGILKIEPVGPYVNFFVDWSVASSDIVADILGSDFGRNVSCKGETIAIDFSAPNIGKPFHFGHLRSTILGESLARLFEFSGAKVLRINHLGDWGTQFGALIYAFLEWGSHKELEKSPISYLVSLYVKFHEAVEKDPALEERAREWFAKLEQGDKTASKLWGEFCSHSLSEFKRVYSILGSSFDSFNGEAYYSRQVSSAVERVQKKGFAVVDDGALIVRFDGIEMPLMLLKKDGSSTYHSRDVATLFDRVDNMKASRVLYVVAHEQALHFKLLFALMGKLGYDESRFAHIAFGLYLGSDGKKFSTRKGKVVLMADVLSEAIGLARKTIDEKNPSLLDKDEVARQVGVGAILFGDLMNDRVKDVVFNLEKILSFEGDTGPYVMYTHARACSVLRKADEEIKASPLSEPVELSLVKLLALFPQKVSSALGEYHPHIIAQYLLEVCRVFNEFYHSCPVLKASGSVRSSRLALVAASRKVIASGLWLLNVHAPVEM